MDKIIEGKEYIFVPRKEDADKWGHLHGRTVVPSLHDPVDDTWVVSLNGPLMVYPDELIDPEVP